MDRELPDLGGRRIERHVRRERILNEASGHEFGAEHIIEVSETFEGILDTTEHMQRQALACGHVYQIGQNLSRCHSCSAKAGHPVYVCATCAVSCPVTGEALCLRCSKLGLDGRRYSPAGLKQAKEMGLFDQPQPTRPCEILPSAAPRGRSLLRRLLEWW